MTPWPWPAPIDDGEAQHLRAGLRLPSVPLISTQGGAVDLSSEKGRLVLYIYTWTGGPGLINPPRWDDIPGAHGSTPQSESFREHCGTFRSMGLKIFGLSSQPSHHQKEFAQRLSLPFAILSDEHLTFADALNLPRFETGGTIFLKRLTMIARDGTIETVFYPVHPPHTHAEAVLAQLKAQKDTPSCP